MSFFHWLISGFALVGVFLNIRKHPSCFAIWAFTNAAWMIVDADHGLIAQAVLQGVYLCLSIYGLIEWSTNPTKKKEKFNGTTHSR
jgi:nicotinamide riboside transporter PnuC